jgi:hypothetical protein
MDQVNPHLAYLQDRSATGEKSEKITTGAGWQGSLNVLCCLVGGGKTKCFCLTFERRKEDEKVYLQRKRSPLKKTEREKREKKKFFS